MVPMAGIGPATSPLPRECSTTEPHGLLTLQTNALFGAGDEARTRDIQFGKLKLYQLSYSRIAAHQSISKYNSQLLLLLTMHLGGGGRIRTFVLRENGFTVRRL